MAKRKRQPAVKAEPLWTRPFLIILGISVFTYTASQMVTPLISKFAISLGAPLTLASTIASFMYLAALFFRPISGILSDRMNRKWIMIISTGIVTLSIGCYAFSTNIATLFTARVLHGIAFSFMGVSNMALGSDFVPTSRMGEGLGYLGLGNILAYAVGPSLGLEVSEKFGYNETYFCRRFKEITGLTFTGYLLALRMERAQKLLMETQEEIGTIAWKCGYADVSYFSHCFKKQFGVSPMGFRKEKDSAILQ